MSDERLHTDQATASRDRGISKADTDQQNFSSSDVGSAVLPCHANDPVQYIVVVPRKPANVFSADKSVKTLLPDRYPGGERIKTIEYNYYPDLNAERAVTAVVTSAPWDPGTDTRPAPLAGVTVYFALGTATNAPCALSASQATTNGEGMASVEITVQSLLARKEDIQVAATVELIASLSPSCEPGNPEAAFTIHRNEDVDDALAPTETPRDFATVLAPVLNLNTWIVRQEEKFVKSNGVKAVQQLLNQVACRKKGGQQFLKPDREFGPGCAAEAKRFLEEFSAKADGQQAASAYRGCRFGVAIEEDAAKHQGVKTYVEAEYGSYEAGTVVDSYFLVGPEQWAAGGNVMDADGLLDVYTAVVWEYLEAGRERASQYADAQKTWYRHPNDDGGSALWPDTVNQGVSYWYGGACNLEDFLSDLDGNFATPPDGANSWYQYLNNDNCRTGLHGSGDLIDIPADKYNQFLHLQNDSDISDVAAANHPPHYVLKHEYIDRVKRQYTGIDCSGFCQRVAIEAKFPADHCADLADQRICTTISEVSYSNGLVQNRLSTSSFAAQYRAISSADWRNEVAFRGDVLNAAGHHIVMLETANRNALTDDSPGVGDLWIYQAYGGTGVAAAVKGIWPQTECVRRVVYSPLAQWTTAWDAWNNSTTNVEYGRIYLWH